MSAKSGQLLRLERHLAWLLVAGVSLAAVCLAAGLILFTLDHRSRPAARALNVGLIVLMATPILRVVVSMVEYVRIRDWLFVLTTVAVLAELAWTLFFAFVNRAPG
ncbi:MAG: DUF1634 domain-containing protein [Vicinamibacterales bacterium]